MSREGSGDERLLLSVITVVLNDDVVRERCDRHAFRVRPPLVGRTAESLKTKEVEA